MLWVADEVTREALAVWVDRKLGSAEVFDLLAQPMPERGLRNVGIFQPTFHQEAISGRSTEFS